MMLGTAMRTVRRMLIQAVLPPIAANLKPEGTTSSYSAITPASP